MKNIFTVLAAFAAAAMLCSVPVNTTAAEETYQMGDVNMDGVVDAGDAQLVLDEYANYALGGHECELSEEQMELASITGMIASDYFHRRDHDHTPITFSLEDAQVILNYYTDAIAHNTSDDIMTYFRKNYSHLFTEE